MSDPALVFALLSGASAAAYTICARLASGGIGASLGAMLVAAVALLVNLGVTLVLRGRGDPLLVTPSGVYWVLGAGVAAAGIDLFGLLACARGFRSRPRRHDRASGDRPAGRASSSEGAVRSAPPSP
jgi:uncharacterized membrane protein